MRNLSRRLRLLFVLMSSIHYGDGSWGQWSDWYGCSKTCGGGGIRNRRRYCFNPNNGNYCYDGSFWKQYHDQHEPCGDAGCPVNGIWSAWTSSGICSVTCGSGTITKNRRCDNPPQSNGGSDCHGSDTDFVPCNNGNCPVDGQWTVWSTWSHCSATCDGGNRTRDRNCSNPLDENGGRNCNGSEIDNDVCSNQFCPAAVTSDAVTKEAAIGGAVGAVVVVLIIVGIVVMLLRKRKTLTAGLRKRSSTNVHVAQAGINVSTTVLDNNQDDAYLKLERVTGMRSIGNDYDELQVHNEVTGDPDNAYCDIALDDSSEYDKR